MTLLIAFGIAGECIAQERPDISPKQGLDDWAQHPPEGRFGGPRLVFQGRGFGGFRDSATSGAMAGFRQNMMAELHNVPLLESKVKRAIQIQTERQTLQRQRELIALSRSKPSAEILSDFHKLLGREDELTSAQNEVVDELLRDSEAIQRQVELRRNELSAKLDEMRKDSPQSGPGAPMSGGLEPRRIWRTLRAYDFIYESLGRLRDNPKRAEWIRGFLRGMWGSEEIDNKIIEQARRRLQELEQDQDDLRRKTEMIDERINELRETLDAAMKKH